MHQLISRVLLFAAACFVGASVSEAEQFAYVSLDGEKRIAVYAIDKESGELALPPHMATPSPPGGLTSD